MTLGTFGSTLNDELNRLANGGTYRTMATMVDEALAAKQWANRENINPVSTDTVGILNEIAGLGTDKRNWLDFNGVCNYLAGTTGLPAAAALRQVYNTTDLLTSQSAYYVDATTPRYNYPGYIYLNGTQTITTPDSAALDVTGDIDLRAKVALADWTPATANSLISKYVTTGNQRSYRLNVATDGTLQLTWSASGTAASGAVASSVATGLADGAVKWVRATLDVDNGASGNTTRFYLSDDGVNWTQLGSAVVNAGVTSIYAGTATLELGASESGSLLTGNYYNAQIYASIDGTNKVLDVDLTTNVTSATMNTFIATTGQLCTINGQDTVTNAGSAGSLLPTTLGSSTAADSNDPKFLDFTGTNYVYTTGVAGNYLSVPDAAALDITGDIDLRVQIAMDDWTPGTTTNFIAKEQSGTTRSYRLGISTGGQLFFNWSADGTTALSSSATIFPLSVADGTSLWIRATLDVDNGAAGNTTTFYTSTNGTTWTQLGDPIVKAGITSIFSSTSILEIGSRFAGSLEPLAGKVYRAQIFNGIDGTKVLDVDTSTLQTGADAYIVPTTYSGAAGAYFTGSGLFLPGTAGNFVTTPDSSALDITGDLDLQVKVAMTDWTPAAQMGLIGKSDVASDAYYLALTSAGALTLVWVDAAGTTFQRTSEALTVADGATLWVRSTLDVDNGASGHSVRFFTSTDGTTWTQVGTTATVAGVTNVRNTTASLQIGNRRTGTDVSAGTFYRAVVKSGIDGFPVFDATFVGVPANSLRMIESSSYNAVVTLNTTRYCTINRSTSGRKTVAVTQPTWLFGTDDYMEVNNRYMAHSTSDENYVYLSGAANNNMTVADNPPLDVTGDIDIQIKVAMDDWTPASSSYLLSKVNGGSGNYSYAMQLTATGLLVLAWSSNGTAFINKQSTASVTATDGAPLWVRATLDVDNGAAGNDVKFFTSTDGTTWTQLGSTVTTAGVTSIYSSTSIVEIGSFIGGSPSKGKFYRAIIKNGIDGTTVLDANASVITDPTQTTFTDSSSNAYTVTINKSGVGTFVSTGNYLYLPGIASNYASTPDSVATSITGDIDIRVKVALDDWTPAASTGLISKYQGSGFFSYGLRVDTTGILRFLYSANGTTEVGITSTVAPTVTDGSTLWVRVTFDVDNGASGNTATFFTSNDGLTWTQLGSPVVTAGVTSIFNSTGTLDVGQLSSGNPARGKFYRAQVYNGINGTLVFDANFESSITSLNQATFTESSSNAATVTINRSGSAYRSAGITTAGYLYPGATNTFTASATDYLNFGATDSFTVLFVGRQWANFVANGPYISKRNFIAASNDLQGYAIGTSVGPQFSVITDGGASENSQLNNMTYGTLSSVGLVANRTNSTLTNYVNNVAVSGALTVGSLSNFATLRIGLLAFYQDFEFLGMAVFRSVLTPAQIRQITNYFANREVYL